MLRDGRATPPGTSYLAEASLAAARHAIVLTGKLGDLAMVRIAPSVSVLEPLHEGHPVQSLALWYNTARALHRPLARSLISILRAAYWPPERPIRGLPWSRRAARRRAALSARAAAARAVGVLPHLLAAAPPLLPPYEPLTEFPLVKRRMVVMLHHNQDLLTSSTRYPAVWETDPYSHRPLVEFVLAAPQLAFWDPVVQRAAMRRALVDVLPPEILQRRDKITADYAIAHARRQQTAAFLEERELIGPAETWQLVTRGYFDGPTLRAAWEKLGSSGSPAPDLLARCVALEAWLRAWPSSARSPRYASTKEATKHDHDGPTVACVT
jgi:hypothetical protein